MIGFIKKDLFMIKANLKTFLITFVLYLILAIQGSFDITFVIPLIGIMLRSEEHTSELQSPR